MASARSRSRSRGRAAKQDDYDRDAEGAADCDEDTPDRDDRPDHEIVAPRVYKLIVMCYCAQQLQYGAFFTSVERRATTLIGMLDIPIRVTVGCSSNPLNRMFSYVKTGHQRMFVIGKSMFASDIMYGESHLIRLLPLIKARTNSGKRVAYANELSGGDGTMAEQEPPYYLYLVFDFCGFIDNICFTGLKTMMKRYHWTCLHGIEFNERLAEMTLKNAHPEEVKDRTLRHVSHPQNQIGELPNLDVSEEGLL
jgi:hypothetical protein